MAGDYTFFIKSLEPQRLLLNGTAVIDDFAVPSRAERSAVYTAAAPGWVSIRYDVSDITGGPVQAKLEWTTPDNPTRRLIRTQETPAVGPGAIAASHQVLRYQTDATLTGQDDDFHLSSTVGSYHGGQWLADTAHSPAIDAGDPTIGVTETVASLGTPLDIQHGNRLNLGFEGNTRRASRSAAETVRVVSPHGGDKVEQGQTIEVRWTSDGLGTPAAYGDVVLGDAPYAYYRLGESSGTTAADSSGSARNGTYVNGVTLGAAGALAGDANTAAQLDGVNDHVDLPDGFADFTGGFSAEVWANPTSVGSWQRFFDLGRGQNLDNIILTREGTTNNLFFQVVSGGVAGGIVRAANAIELNTWQHFAVTMDATGQVTLYKNGEVIASGTTTVPGNLTRTSSFIGRSNWSTDAFYAGRMDEVSFYSRALNVAEVRSHYRSLDRGAVDIDLVRGDNPASVATIATATDDDGVFAWTIPTSVTPANDYRLRIRASQGLAEGRSYAPFLITADTNVFYVNDTALTGDQFTTAVGNNANSGTTPDDPVRSIYTLIHSYDLGPGDVIRVDTGSYHVPINIRIAAEDAGVTIVGPTGGADGAARPPQHERSSHRRRAPLRFRYCGRVRSDVPQSFADRRGTGTARRGRPPSPCRRARSHSTMTTSGSSPTGPAPRRFSPAIRPTARRAIGRRTRIPASKFEATNALVENNIAFKIGTQFGAGLVVGSFSSGQHDRQFYGPQQPGP